MSRVSTEEEASFFNDVEAASKKAIWCALASVEGSAPRVRMVHPTWEGKTLWLATGRTSPKARQITTNPNVDVQFQVAPPDFIHILVRGQAALTLDPDEKKRVWDVIDYDLAQFWPGGPDDPNYAPVKITPTRVELSKMFGSVDKRIWRG